MIRFIKRFNEFVRLGISFFKTYDKLLKNLNYLSGMIDSLIKEQNRLNKTMEDYTRFSKKTVEQERREAVLREEELKPSEYDMKY